MAIKNTFIWKHLVVKAKTYKEAIQKMNEMQVLIINKKDVIKLNLSDSDYMNNKIN